jgi:hypothetical protein
MAKQCTKCGSVKERKQFSKRSSSKDGLQSHCKECNVKENHLFRNELNPNYMKGWLKTHRTEWNEYISDYAASGNINTIYTITSPENKVYVGITRRKRPSFRFTEHKTFYKMKSSNNFLPLLYASFDKWKVENHTFEPIHQFKGTRKQGMKVESRLIKFYKSIDKSLNKNN